MWHWAKIQVVQQKFIKSQQDLEYLPNYQMSLPAALSHLLSSPAKNKEKGVENLTLI